MTANNGSLLVTLRGNNENVTSTAYGAEGPIAVNGNVRTTGIAVGTYGASYDLSGNNTGNAYLSPFAQSAEDGTTDGLFNFVIDDSGNVFRTNSAYQQPQLLFSVLNGTGISYEPSNSSLWVDVGGVLTDYTLAGDVLGAFAANSSLPAALAYDPSDGTLWVGTQGGAGVATVLYQYGTGGNLRQVFAPTSGVTVDGMEFREPTVAPEPAPMAALGFGIVGLLALRRRKL